MIRGGIPDREIVAYFGRSRAEHGSLKPAVRTLFSRQPVKDYPHLFLVLDDFVALELSEEAITLLEWILQKARLVKVHVILVTSLPSSRSLSSGILSNTDYRIAFRVTSKADSIRAIGRAGANELATPGEMIVRNGSDIVRCKAAYMADDDLRRLCMEAAERYEDEVPRFADQPCTARRPFVRAVSAAWLGLL